MYKSDMQHFEGGMKDEGLKPNSKSHQLLLSLPLRYGSASRVSVDDTL